MRKLLSALAALIMVLALAKPANALEGGSEDAENPRVVSLNGCTGFLYSPRIVLTAAHCEGAEVAMKPMLKTTPRPNSTNSAEIIKFIQHEDYQYRANGWPDMNDFAVAILDRPLADISEAKLVDELTLLKMAETRAEVFFTGYGLQSLKDREDSKVNPRYVYPRTTQFNLIPRAEGLKRIQEMVSYTDGLDGYPNDLIMVDQPYGGPQTCDGDSGSGYYLRDGDEFTYLGVTHWPLGGRNCYTDDLLGGWYKGDATVGMFPVYRGLHMISEAQEFIAANPSKLGIPAVGKPKNYVLPSFPSTLSSTVKARVKNYLESNRGVTKFICTSVRFSNTPRSTSIAMRVKAKAVCEYAKSLRPNLSIWHQSKVTTKSRAFGMQLVTLKFD